MQMLQQPIIRIMTYQDNGYETFSFYSEFLQKITSFKLTTKKLTLLKKLVLVITFDRSLANSTGLLLRGLCCPSSQNLIKKGPAWNHGCQGCLNPFSPIVRFLATPQRHIITSTDPRHWRRTFLGTSDAIFNVQWDIFKKCHKLLPNVLLVINDR